MSGEVNDAITPAMLTRFAVDVYENARAKGFWDKERTETEQRMLCTSEIFEAFEEWRGGRMEIWFRVENPKPEGFVIELADVVIRCLDWICHKGQSVRLWNMRVDDEAVDVLDACVRDYYAGMGENWLISQITCLADELSLDLWEAMKIKHAYNLTRPPMHGGKRL